MRKLRISLVRIKIAFESLRLQKKIAACAFLIMTGLNLYLGGTIESAHSDFSQLQD